MNIPEEFGNYLLLKKLREDALGETFRAGKVGKDGIEQVVLLRVFNGQGINGEKLWQKISGRAAIQQALRSPNIGSGVDLGKVRSYPYAAYDYISGKSLHTLLAQSAAKRVPIPADHALLISERLALALAAAYETRVHDERVLHGFVVPHLAMVSNEGETRLLGFEVAAGLRELWTDGWHHEELQPYLSPESAGGGALTRSDDVYSLGAILYELLTGERLPAAGAAPGGFPALIDGALLAGEGTPLPQSIAGLLKKSLVPREQRVPDAVTWHKTISKLMIEGHYSSTTFNLAFYMHNLFRDEIDRESQEMEAEKKLELPAYSALRTAAAAPAGAGAAAAPIHSGMREPAGVREATFPGTMARSATTAPPSKNPLWIGIAAAVVLLAVGGYFLFGRSSSGGAQGAAKGAAAAAANRAAAAGAAGSPAGAASAPASAGGDAAARETALQAQIQQMFEARSKEMEAKLKTQYDDRIKQLQQKLDESHRAAAAAGQERPKPERQAAAADKAESAEPAASTLTSKKPEPVPAAAASPSAASPQPNTATGERGAAASTAAAASGATAPPPSPASQPDAGTRPQVQVGDLVQPGPGVAAPKLLSRPEARYPAAARRMNNRAADVNIKVLVDERGQVLQADEMGERVGLGFDEAALEVARRTIYNPATKDGVKVKMWAYMHITFKPPAG
ncbi:MAG TPA: TonB family protein [Thermoanaerobaculia bacterium]|nr:TonB family protein [Thermoanaerobaculia bacterium]